VVDVTTLTDDEGLLVARTTLPRDELGLVEGRKSLVVQQHRRRLATAVASHDQLVWRALRRFGVPERDVEDAAQQVFLAFARRLAEVESGKEAAYLVAIVVRVAANARRKLERSPELLSGNVEIAPALCTPEGLLNEKQLREELDRGLSTLPLEQRAVFVLFELEGFSLPEIAEALRIPLGTATSRLRRARAHFEAWVKARGTAKGDEP
jgi:RNA polymerase sigma-70 factor (ECF subfamily)